MILKDGEYVDTEIVIGDVTINEVPTETDRLLSIEAAIADIALLGGKDNV